MTPVRVLVATGLAIALMCVTAQGDEPTVDVGVVAASLELTTPAAPLGDPVPLDAKQAADAAAVLARDIPLPEGGTFNGIRWGDLEGTIGSDQLRTVLQYNAACQWYRAWRDGRQPKAAAAVIAAIPAWPAIRGAHPQAELTAAVAQDVAAGGGPALDGVLRDCDAAHDREIAYAAVHGTVASR